VPGWWSRLFGRGAAAAPPSRGLPPSVVPEPAPRAPAHEPEPTPADSGDISPARLDAALQRLRKENPPAPED
jgi:hypothetical protein